MRSFRAFQQAASLVSFKTLRLPPQSLFRNLEQAPSCRSSPFFNLLSRHSQRQSIRHLHQAFAPKSLHSKASKLSRKSQRRPYSSDRKPPPDTSEAATESLSLSQRLRKLSREYGWSAIGVYFALSALDFPFCFIAVQMLGTDRIGRWEHRVVEWVKRAVPVNWDKIWAKSQMVATENGTLEAANDELQVAYDHGVRDAEKANAGETASIWTQLALAYAIHKSFIFIRVPLAAAVTPKVVRVLRGWGWDIGKRKSKTVSSRVAAVKKE